MRLPVFTGPRGGEILGPRCKCVDCDRGLLRLPDSKTGAKAIHLYTPAPACRSIDGFLGHRQASTTPRYAHLADDPLCSASALMGSRIAAALEVRP